MYMYMYTYTFILPCLGGHGARGPVPLPSSVVCIAILLPASVIAGHRAWVQCQLADLEICD